MTEEVEMDNKFFRVLVTRDATESALIPVSANSPAEAGEIATSRETTTANSHLFQVNDSASESGAYLGDPEEDVTEIDEKEHLALVAKAAIPEIEPFEFVVEVRATNEFVSGPEFAVITVDTAFVRNLVRLHGLIKANGLGDVGVSYCPKQWSQDEQFLIRGDTLRVTNGGSFWVEGHPKHSDWGVETRAIDLDDFLKVVVGGPNAEPSDSEFRWVGGRLFYSSSPDYLIETFMDEEGASNE